MTHDIQERFIILYDIYQNSIKNVQVSGVINVNVLTAVCDVDGTGGADPSLSTKVEAPAPTKLVDQMPVIPDYLKPKPQKTVRYFLKYTQ